MEPGSRISEASQQHFCQRKSGHNDHILAESQDDNQSSLPHRDLSDCLIDDDILRGEVVGKLTKVWTCVMGND